MFEKHLISKLSFCQSEKKIKSVYVHSYDCDGNYSNSSEHDRKWLVNRVDDLDYIFALEYDQGGNWVCGNKFEYKNSLFRWNCILPKNIGKRNVFISFYHKDEKYKLLLERLLQDLSINQSVHDGDIDSDNADEYIRHLIQDNHLKDTTVLIVLIGPNTKNRKHVDWEISGALNYKVGNRYAGVLGLILPNHSDYGSDYATFSLMPQRLAANFRSRYAVIRDWTMDRRKLQNYIEEAFANREKDSLIENKKILLMNDDLPDESNQ